MMLAIAYGAGSAALVVLLTLIVLGSGPAGAGRNVVLGCVTTLAWTLACVFVPDRFAGFTQVLEQTRSAAWLFFLGALLEAIPGSHNASGLKHARALALG